jgi:hypothetical protein
MAPKAAKDKTKKASSADMKKPSTTKPRGGPTSTKKSGNRGG